MTVFDWIADYPRLTIMLIAVALNWIAAFILYRVKRHGSASTALRYTADRAIVIAVAVTVLAYLWLELRVDFEVIPRDFALWLWFFVIILMTIPTVGFLYKYFTNQIGSEK